ncbi:programmed cell death 1 ligand 1-like isoform X2 [Centroberyx affinis]|uniref:programmed cell death 1 ligand 1-like isoform X2 n=1 Tax=Centroberyx affinis TaxID=166261 RepID=UPI003A5C1DC2
MTWILLLLFLTSCVCGTFIVNVKQISYQAEENGNVTMEWIFPPKPDMSLSSLGIYCALRLSFPKTLYHRLRSIEHQLPQDEYFAGRVRCDEDVLREGHILLHLSRLRTDDSGTYFCKVATGYDGGNNECLLTVTAAEHLPEDAEHLPEDAEHLPEDPEQRERGRFGLIGAVAAVALVALVAFLHQCCCPKDKYGTDQDHEENVAVDLPV